MKQGPHTRHGVFRENLWPASQGTGPYLLGMALIIYGYAFIGFVTQIYGFWKLFASFLPNVIQSIKMVTLGMLQRKSGLRAGELLDRVRPQASRCAVFSPTFGRQCVMVWIVVSCVWMFMALRGPHGLRGSASHST